MVLEDLLAEVKTVDKGFPESTVLAFEANKSVNHISFTVRACKQSTDEHLDKGSAWDPEWDGILQGSLWCSEISVKYHNTREKDHIATKIKIR